MLFYFIKNSHFSSFIILHNYYSFIKYSIISFINCSISISIPMNRKFIYVYYQYLYFIQSVYFRFLFTNSPTYRDNGDIMKPNGFNLSPNNISNISFIHSFYKRVKYIHYISTIFLTKWIYR